MHVHHVCTCGDTGFSYKMYMYMLEDSFRERDCACWCYGPHSGVFNAFFSCWSRGKLVSRGSGDGMRGVGYKSRGKRDERTGVLECMYTCVDFTSLICEEGC